MKHNKILYACIFLFVRSYSAADDTAERTTLSRHVSSSSETRKRETPSCAREESYVTKKQRCIFGGALRLSRVVPGGRGKSYDEVNLTQQDYISKQTFAEHMKEDFERGIPWIVAAFNYTSELNGLSRDFGDGRYWHEYWNGSAVRSKRHPLYNGTFVGQPEYYTVEYKNGKPEAHFLGTESDISNKSAGLIMRLMLNVEQDPALWVRISSACLSLAQYERALTWLHAIVPPLAAEQHDQACDLNAVTVEVDRIIPHLHEQKIGYGVLLKQIGLAYYRKNNTIAARDYLLRALPVLENEQNKPVGAIYSLLGQMALSMKEFDNAEADFSKAWMHLKAERKEYGHVLKKLGCMYYTKKEWIKAADTLHTAITVLKREKKSIFGALYTKARAYFKLALWNDSIQTFQRILNECAPQAIADKWNHIGLAREHQGRISEAVQAYATSCRVNDISFQTNFVNLLYNYAVHKDQCRYLTDVSMKSFAKKLLKIYPHEEEYFSQKCPERYAVAKQEAERLIELGNARIANSSGSYSLLLPSNSPEY